MSRRYIQLDLPAGARQLGELPEEIGPDDLWEDMLFVELPGGVVVDVGWYHGGRVRVVAVDGDWDTGQLEDRQADTAAEIKKHVEELSAKYTRP